MHLWSAGWAGPQITKIETGVGNTVQIHTVNGGSTRFLPYEEIAVVPKGIDVPILGDTIFNTQE